MDFIRRLIRAAITLDELEISDIDIVSVEVLFNGMVEFRVTEHAFEVARRRWDVSVAENRLFGETVQRSFIVGEHNFKFTAVRFCSEGATK